MLNNSAGFSPAPVVLLAPEPAKRRNQNDGRCCGVDYGLHCFLLRLSDNLTHSAIRSACQIFFDIVLAKIVMDCHERDISQPFAAARVLGLIGYIVIFLLRFTVNIIYR
jgi:hypothetical protein